MRVDSALRKVADFMDGQSRSDQGPNGRHSVHGQGIPAALQTPDNGANIVETVRLGAGVRRKLGQRRRELLVRGIPGCTRLKLEAGVPRGVVRIVAPDFQSGSTLWVCNQLR